MRIVFRTDASVLIGTGHVMRCLTLANLLSQYGHDCLFISRSHEGNLNELIKKKGFRLIQLYAPKYFDLSMQNVNEDMYATWLGVPWEDDAYQSLNAVMSFSPDWLIVDHYALDAKWERIMSEVVGKIMVIDDLANRDHECTLLLDQNLGRRFSDYDGLVPAKCHRLIGPKYALLRPEFAQQRMRCLGRQKVAKLNRILISLGGVDNTNVTGQVLDALSRSSLSKSIELDIVMGDSAPYLNYVRLQAKKLPFNATVNVNVTNMAERMSLADLSIGAAGATSWERCCIGLPSIAIVLADNQQMIGAALAEKGAGVVLDAKKIDEDLIKVIKSITSSDKKLLNCIQKAKEVCDGNGTSRVISFMTEVMQ